MMRTERLLILQIHGSNMQVFAIVQATFHHFPALLDFEFTDLSSSIQVECS